MTLSYKELSAFNDHMESAMEQVRLAAFQFFDLGLTPYPVMIIVGVDQSHGTVQLAVGRSGPYPGLPDDPAKFSAVIAYALSGEIESVTMDGSDAK